MKKLLYIICIAAFSIANCKEKEKSDDATNLGLLAILSNQGSTISEIPFALVAGEDTQFSCSRYTTGHTRHISESLNFYLKDARFYVHDVKLIKSDGTTTDFTLIADNKWQTSKVALLDFEDGTGDCSAGTTDTNKSIKGSAPAGNYIGVEFKVGVPLELNHLLNTSADAPLNSSAMYWAWTSGYKFLKFEWVTKDGASTNGTFHLGSGTCSGSGASTTCTYPNRPTISIKTSGNVTWNPTAKPVYFDAKSLVSGTNTNPSSGGAALTCMAGNATAACKALLNNVGVNETNGATLTVQSAFYLKP